MRQLSFAPYPGWDRGSTVPLSGKPSPSVPSCLCSQARAELSSMEVPPVPEPGDTGGWGRSAESSLRAQASPRSPRLPGLRLQQPLFIGPSLSSFHPRDTQLAVQKYEELFPAFSDSRECKLMKVSVGAPFPALSTWAWRWVAASRAGIRRLGSG